MVMIVVQVLFLFVILILVKANIHLYYTEDSRSVEFYDCLFHSTFVYCRRPAMPIALHRENNFRRCYHGGILHSFSHLQRTNVSVTAVTLEWKSTLEMAGRYAYYLQKPDQKNDGYLCQCNINVKSFGKYCEYLLPTGSTFSTLVQEQMKVKEANEEEVQKYSDVICYNTIECNSGLLCLDWRDICDGIQQCMFGYDEENCDKLEFNECEANEYRCMNGMCIPNEYFLDGEYDCMDLSDEKGLFDDQSCTFQQISLQCDERLCSPNYWSCGDGQCIPDRFDFHKSSTITATCRNRRNQYFMCEIHPKMSMWTMPNGKCYGGSDYIEDPKLDQCAYFTRCSFLSGTLANCQCGSGHDYCYSAANNSCLDAHIRYPDGSIVGPFLIFIYEKTRDWTVSRPDLMQINATIKCRGYMVHYETTQKYAKDFNFRQFEDEACQKGKKLVISSKSGYDINCYRNSRTFNHQSYNFVDVCQQSRECISTYRIQDGFANCLDGNDEKQTKGTFNTCSGLQHHRFRCSTNQSTCLSPLSLGNLDVDCDNRFDESWFGTDITLAKLSCKYNSKDDCLFIRQYIERSWSFDKDSVQNMNATKTIPFRAYCDSFWDFSSRKDEDTELCRAWWKCLENQWQCRTGQCINLKWVLDGEWDCSDASDEEGILFPNNTFSSRNEKLISAESIIQKFKHDYENAPLMSLCDHFMEFPCFRINSSDPLGNINGTNLPCIPLEKLGDGHIDCLGALDEQNTEEFCRRTTMLGKNFKCLSSNTCLSYSSVCDIRCPNQSDDRTVCYGEMRLPNCSRPQTDFTCFDSQCATGGWCDSEPDCTHSEDEYLCGEEKIFTKKPRESIHRRNKEITVDYRNQPSQLPRIPAHMNKTKRIESPSTKTIESSARTILDDLSTSLVSYQCNRGVGVFTLNSSVVCFCPQQYYGDRCQYHNDRITVMLHMNFSQSIYVQSNDASLLLKMLILFIFNDEVLSSYEFHARPAVELTTYYKKIDHVVYSHSNQSMLYKRSRYLDRSNITLQHPYAVRIEVFHVKSDEKPSLIAVWQYPIYFDFLPSYRFAKVLHLTVPQTVGNPCSSSPCGKHRICQQILNDKSNYVCLCPENFHGANCSILDQTCKNGYCAKDALCKPAYRGLLNRNELPYCVCPKGMYGFRCALKQDQCDSNPCRNNGTCIQAATPGKYYCVCGQHYQGTYCENERDVVRLYVNKSIEHQAAVIQYFSIDYTNLELVLDEQQLFKQLPSSIFYQHEQKRKLSEIILIRLYRELQVSIHLISVYIDSTSFNATIEATEMNLCQHVDKLFPANEEISPIKYHFLCTNGTDLLCFYDMNYLCICDENHTRTECFEYDHSLDRCFNCLSGGKCIQGNRLKADDYLCICLPCHSGKSCQFSSKSFSFTLDQLFSADLLSRNRFVRYASIYLLTIGSSIIFLIGFINNIFAFVTFRRPKCRRYGSGQYLLFMSIINQISLGVLALRLIHLTVNMLTQYFHPTFNNVCCSLLNYLLKSSSRLTYWLVALIAIERVYTTVFLNKQWLKKPYIARRLIILTTSGILVTSAYELPFVTSHSGFNDAKSSICILAFPNHDSGWVYIHQGVTIINALVPFVINLCSMITIMYVVIQKKMLVSQGNIYSVRDENRIMSSVIQKDVSGSGGGDRSQSRLELFREVLYENKELIIGPAVTLVPQLFSLPLFITSLTLACQTIETSSIRYLIIISYFITFIPQLISFFLYVSPSSLYSHEWHATDLSKRLTMLRYFRRSTKTAIRDSFDQIEDKHCTK
ncbi:unnamed protein product [Adineta ricciae]|uniref:Uncharacterized protein n=1 Tax=Adineta ricciae TaxID=249248 RepID=A0A813TZJ5_ADIRI|nr:unnamed protein product [Adineta ricciae]